MLLFLIEKIYNDVIMYLLVKRFSKQFKCFVRFRSDSTPSIHVLSIASCEDLDLKQEGQVLTFHKTARAVVK